MFILDRLTQIKLIRKFNRDYTTKIGILEKHVLDSEYTLAESRILLEIKNFNNCKLKDLSENLHMDAGFVSRVLAELLKRKLINKTPSSEDKRAFILNLTDLGEKVLTDLNNKSNKQINALINELNDNEQTKLINSITSINQLLLNKSTNKTPLITIKNELAPGDVGRLITLHGELYKKECEFNEVFEGYVCKTFYEVLVNGNKKLDKFWLAEASGEIIGSIAIIAKNENTCQLRWLLVSPKYRKLGLGNRLISIAMKYAASKKFTKIFLETTNQQKEASALYHKLGFIDKQTYDINDWGKKLKGITMEKSL